MCLTAFTQLAAATLPFAEKMDRMACLVRDALQACLCVIYLFEAEQVRVWLSNHPSRDLPERIAAERLALERWHHTGLLPISPQPNAAHATRYAPIAQRGIFLGLLSCSFAYPSEETPEERELLQGMANIIALAWHAEHLENTLSQQFMSPLALIASLRKDPSVLTTLSQEAVTLPDILRQPHVVAVIQGGNEMEGIKSQAADELITVMLHQCFQEQFPDALLLIQEDLATAFIPLKGTSIPRVQEGLRELVQAVREDDHHVRLTIGLSNPCLDIQATTTGWHEAEEALVVGRHLPGRPPVIQAGDLGLARYLARLAHDPLPDPLQDQLRRLVQYDEQRAGSHLLDTLEVYLDCWGNIARVA